VIDLCHWLHDEFQVSVSEQTLSRELRELGYRKKLGKRKKEKKRKEAG
jgi:arginine repressor